MECRCGGSGGVGLGWLSGALGDGVCDLVPEGDDAVYTLIS